MKIKVNGNLKRTEKEFICELCGCNFTADATEYNVNYRYNTTEIEQIKMKCPCCHAPVIFHDLCETVLLSLEDDDIIQQSNSNAVKTQKKYKVMQEDKQ